MLPAAEDDDGTEDEDQAGCPASEAEQTLHRSCKDNNTVIVDEDYK